MAEAFQNPAVTLISFGKRDNNRKPSNPDLKHTLNHTLHEQRRSDCSQVFADSSPNKRNICLFFSFLLGTTQTFATSAVQPSLSSGPREDERAPSGSEPSEGERSLLQCVTGLRLTIFWDLVFVRDSDVEKNMELNLVLFSPALFLALMQSFESFPQNPRGLTFMDVKSQLEAPPL